MHYELYEHIPAGAVFETRYYIFIIIKNSEQLRVMQIVQIR